MTSSSEHRIYLALWRKAVLESRDIRVNLKNAAEVMSLRRALYRALLPYKTNKLHDPVLSEAIERLGVFQHLNDPPHLIIRQRQGYDLAMGLVDQFGLTEEDMLSTEEKDLQEKFLPKSSSLLTPLPPRDLIEPESSDGPHREQSTNPFFSRED